MRVAIVGCGQLARMLAFSGIPLGINFSFLANDGEHSDTRCVQGLGNIVHWHNELEGEDLYQALGNPDVLTFEKESVDINTIESLSGFCDIAPSFKALSVSQHRRSEKELLSSLSIPTARFGYADNASQLTQLVTQLGLPVVVKSVSQGYDGKQQWHIKAACDIDSIPNDAVVNGVIVEQWIAFSKEVSLIGVRNKSGEVRCYPLTENIHRDGILIRSIAPAPELAEEHEQQARGYLGQLLNTLDYVGVMAMECFVTPEGLLVNELAPRVHNSGHWTQEGAVTCQFENHIRAITGLALGETKAHGFAGMVNLLGPHSPPRHLLSDNSTLHWYDKLDRAGRKLGHVNFIARSRQLLETEMQRFLSRQ